MRAKASPWVAGTVVVSVIVAALAWFLAISPTMASAASARSDTEAAETRNVQLRAQLALLEKQAAGLEATKAELATISGQIPTEMQLAAYVRTLQAAAEAAGVTLVGHEAEEPADIFPAGVDPATVAAAPVDGTAGGEAAGDATATDAAGSGTDAPDPASAGDGGVVTAGGTAETPGHLPVEGFAGTLMRVTVIGPSEAVLAFLDQVQSQQERLFLVTEYTATGLSQAEASGGRPAVEDGHVELVLSGYVYALPTLAPAAPAPVDDGAAAPVLPGPVAPRVAGR